METEKKEVAMEEACIKAFQEGVTAGMDNAGGMILAALEESPIDRIKKICREKLIIQKDDSF